jgi:hypothetical protein
MVPLVTGPSVMLGSEPFCAAGGDTFFEYAIIALIEIVYRAISRIHIPVMGMLRLSSHFTCTIGPRVGVFELLTFRTAAWPGWRIVKGNLFHSNTCTDLQLLADR